MIQAIYCSCGESSMMDGKCIGCKKIRPSRQEIIEDLEDNKKKRLTLLESLERVLNLEVGE
jgi:hypothetical protein